MHPVSHAVPMQHQSSLSIVDVKHYQAFAKSGDDAGGGSGHREQWGIIQHCL